MANHFLDITNKKYGLLTAIKSHSKDNFGRYKWLFKCECGNETVASLNNVRTGTTKSCGCLKVGNEFRRIDLTGKKFGRLYVNSPYKLIDGDLYWNCTCDCGVEKKVKGVSLRIGKTKSCGCYNKEIISKRSSEKTKIGYDVGINKWRKTILNCYKGCVNCGDTSNLEVHHIYSNKRFPELSRDFSNGVVLCKSCHSDFHSKYTRYTFTDLDFYEFIGLDLNIKNILTNFVGYKSKNGIQDLNKARHYLDILIEHEQRRNESGDCEERSGTSGTI